MNLKHTFNIKFQCLNKTNHIIVSALPETLHLAIYNTLFSKKYYFEVSFSYPS